MAVGQMGVLGISSNLSWDVLNQLKDNDIKNQIDPITKKIETNMEKQTELTSLLTMMTSLNTNFKNLSDFSTYQKRSTSVEGSGIKATAGEGLAIQDIKINVKQLAQNDVNQVGMKFSSRDSVFSTNNTTLKFYHNGTNYSIDIKAGMSVAEVGQAITDATDGDVMGIIMKTGGDNPYQLMIQGKDSGAQNKIYFGNTLESAAMPGGKITSGTFEIEIGGKTISIDLANDVASKLGNTAEDNAKAVLEVINQKIENDSSLSDIKDKLKNGEITIGLNSTGKGLLLNDSKGGEIKVNVTDAKIQAAEGVSEVKTDLGFVKTYAGSADSELVKGSTAVKGGAINGQLTFHLADGIGSRTIYLTGLTDASNTGAQNAERIAQEINTIMPGEVQAEVKDGKLVLKSLDGNDIRISVEGADDAEKKATLDSLGVAEGNYSSDKNFLDKMNITNIQKAQNAQFTYNGIAIERDKNSFDDVVSGLSLELTGITEANKDVIVRVTRDDSGIAEEMEKFVENYNTMYNKIKELMRYDEDTKVAGVFNGDSDIRQIIRQFNSIISSNDVNGDNLVKYGVYFNEDGTLQMDKDKFSTAFKEDPDKAVAFFRSTTSVSRGISTEVDGVFTKLRNTMDKLITGSNSTLKLLETSLVNEGKTLSEDKTKTQESIDSRYETMASKWSAYDQLIAKTQQQSQVVQNMIQSMYSSN